MKKKKIYKITNRFLFRCLVSKEKEEGERDKFSIYRNY